MGVTKGRRSEVSGQIFSKSRTAGPPLSSWKSGAISHKGSSTNRLMCMRGWGNVRSGVSSLTPSMASRSKSMVRDAYPSELASLRRPRASSISNISLKICSGLQVSGNSNRTTWLTKSGASVDISHGAVWNLREDMGEHFHRSAIK